MMMSRPLRTLSLLFATAWLLPAGAGVTTIDQKPLIVANPDAVKANLLFILDDSGSMDFDFTPDHINTALCRSATTLATSENSGSFTSLCCLNGGSSTACFVDSDPTDKAPPRGQPPFLASGFNRQYYDPSVYYKPPVKADGTYWPSQTASATTSWTVVRNDAYSVQSKASINLVTGFPDTEWCTDAKDIYGNYTYADCLRNGNYVLPGVVDRSTVAGTTDKRSYTVFHAVTAKDSGLIAVGAPDAPTTTTRKFGPHYYDINAAEFCSTPDLRDCKPTAQSGYAIPAAVRWCNSDTAARAAEPAAYACQATRNGTFSHARFPTKFLTKGTDASPGKGSSLTFQIALSGTCNTSNTASVSSLKISGTEHLSGTTATATKSSSLAGNIVAKFGKVPGWTATNSGSTVTITAPVAAGDLAGVYATLTAGSASSKCKFTPTTNAGPFTTDYQAPVTTAKPASYAGSFTRVDIHPDTPNYTRPATRTDCAAIKTSGTCTYAEEMTNFANWWTYYHSRMQAMKSGASLAFGDVGNNRRVGYLSINNATTKDFLNLDDFESTQRTKWFAKLTAAIPSGSTPLRGALSKAGRLFAGVYNGQTLNGSTVDDPVQYSCQRNAAILSTDGFWNNDVTPTRPDGTEVGDVDSDAVTVKRPKYDGKSAKNTLADTAYYYRNTDLRTGKIGETTVSCTSGNSKSTADVCGTDDPINHTQTMMTFTLGLGVSGYMQFLPDYVNAPDFRAVTNGYAADPGAGVCSWQTSGVCEWPVPANNTLTAVDDLWHAAVNGDGTYFSATSPTDLYNGLSKALKQFDAQTGAAAAATTSNPNVTSGDNQAFVSSFTSSQWTGQLLSKSINLDTGRLDDVNWSAQTLLDNASSRAIYMFSAGGTNNLKPFSWASMTSAEKAYFQTSHITASGRSLSQFCTGPAYCLSSTDQGLAAGEPLVEYLRGARANEGEVDSVEPNTKYYRGRAHVLGDIVNSEAVYVNKQLVRYADEGYAEFNARARTPMVYVGANDGMLHAFNATTGNEVWAFVPTAVLPNLYKLADKQYATNHQYFVDATPVVQDIKIGSEWRTILVGGLGAGGRAYYALDITDPAEPKALWEFTHDNLGLTFGQAEIGKLRDGTWVVIVASGYNNVSPGDGKGRLFVLDAATGKPVDGMPNGIAADVIPSGVATTVGDTSTPAGLAHIRGWLENSRLDNTIQRVYGGDNLGNVWRFDINNMLGAAGYDAQLLAVLKNASGTPQPVTSRPELGDVNGIAMVYVGTGRYLGTPDLSDATVQSIYAIKDPLTNASHGEVRAGGKFVQQTLVMKDASNKNLTCPDGVSWCTSGQTVRMSTSTLPVNLAKDDGWYVDLPLSRERVNNDPLLVLGTLVVISNVIEPGNLCKVGGSSWVNYFDYKTGQASSVALGDVLSSRPTVYRLPNGKLVGLARDSSGGDRYFDPPVGPQVSTTRRVSWRDLLQE